MDASNRDVTNGTLSVRVIANDATPTLALSGELDLANAETFAAELERVESDAPTMITVDMQELEFIDSTGIAVLVAAHRRLNDGGLRIRLVRSRASAVRRVLDVTGLDAELPFVDPGEISGTEPGLAQ
jgi:anti-sigma B factor antagonist